MNSEKFYFFLTMPTIPTCQIGRHKLMCTIHHRVYFDTLSEHLTYGVWSTEFGLLLLLEFFLSIFNGEQNHDVPCTTAYVLGKRTFMIFFRSFCCRNSNDLWNFNQKKIHKWKIYLRTWPMIYC